MAVSSQAELADETTGETDASPRKCRPSILILDGLQISTSGIAMPL